MFNRIPKKKGKALLVISVMTMSLITYSMLVGFSDVESTLSTLTIHHETRECSTPIISQLTSHDPIVITSNLDFETQGWPGSGTELDPYVIESLAIHVTHSDVSINISNTDVHFEIRHCVLTSNSTDTVEIYLEGVSNCEIWNTTFLDSKFGIRMESCEQLIIQDNLFLNLSGKCMYMLRTNNSVFSANNCTNCGGFSSTFSSLSNVFEDNYCYSFISGKRSGISLYYSNSSIVRNNEIHSIYMSVYMLKCSDNQLIGNNCTSSAYGLSVGLIENCEIIGNFFNGNHTSYKGIFFGANCVSNIVQDNKCTLNEIGIYLDEDSNDNKITSNICNNNSIGIYLDYDCNSNEITSNICDNNEIGIQIDFTDFNVVQGNLLRNNNDTGIRAYYVENTTITENHIDCGFADWSEGIWVAGYFINVTYNNIEYCNEGILLDEMSEDCYIHGNVINHTDNGIAGLTVNNVLITWNIFDDYNSIYLDSGYTVQYNYWSNYTGNDTNGDGFGDTPYPTGLTSDPYPLMYLPILPSWVAEPTDQTNEYGEDFYYVLSVTSFPRMAPIVSWSINNTGAFNVVDGVITNKIPLVLLADIPLEVRVNNIYAQYLLGTFKVTVQDTTLPVLSSPDDIIYPEGTTGNWVNWTATDLLPDLYSITLDGVLLQSGMWNNSFEIISIRCDGLSVGDHQYRLTMTDEAGNEVGDSVLVTVISGFDPTLYVVLVGTGIGAVAVVVVVYKLKKKQNL